MNRRIRLTLFAVSALALAWFFRLGYGGIAPVGAGQSAYGDAVNAVVVPARHITDAVTAVNFDIRGFDTLGEEFILFTSVIGIVVLMRRQEDEPQGEHDDKAKGRQPPPRSDAVRLAALSLLTPLVLFGLYVVTHGQVTPGGGFQGGVILSTAPLLLYLSADDRAFERAVPRRLVQAAEALGAAAYILVGIACVALGGVFLQNVFPLGASGGVTGGGTVAWIDIGVGFEVSGGLALAVAAYMEELIEDKQE